METKTCQNCKSEFRIEPEDFMFYEKMKVPPPTWCPECRLQRRLLFRNQRVLFRRKDDASGNEIFSSFPPQAPIHVYDHDYWNSDAWDPLQYGREYDFSRPFFEQFRELFYTVPLLSRSVIRMVNSDYCDQSGSVRNSYLCFHGDYIENSAYSVGIHNVKDSVDLYGSMRSEFCYDSSLIAGGYRVVSSFNCTDCQDVWFSKDLRGCTYCIGCVGLRNKSYYMFNEPYGKEQYLDKLAALNLGSWEVIQDTSSRAHAIWNRFPVKYMHGTHNVNSSGEQINNSKNVTHSYEVDEGEDIKYSQFLYLKPADSYDYTVWGGGSSLIYECLCCGEQNRNLKFCWECWPGNQDLAYCAFCHASSNLFGCVSIKKKSYCILNKQYSKEEYEKLVPRIIEHMNAVPYVDGKKRVYRYGEFFPPEFSPFAYNETLLNDFYPLSREKAAREGYPWRDPKPREYQTTLTADELPDHIGEVGDTILKEIIQCRSCKKAYRIIPIELEFYRKMQIPIPRSCHNCRFAVRFKSINPPRSYHRGCQCAGAKSESGVYANQATHFHQNQPCPNEFETSYAPERPEIVYCEQCYQAEVI